MIKLVAIDLDGTFFDSHSQVPEENKKAIEFLNDNHIYPVISTGRPFGGIPQILLDDFDFKYAITANGAAVYEIATGKLICQNSMDNELTFPIIDYLITKDIHMDAFIDGKGISTFKCLAAGEKLPLPSALKDYVLHNRTRVDDLKDYLISKNTTIQKCTLNFYKDENGVLVDREEIKSYLENHPGVDSVCGGYNNLEFTRKGINKGLALSLLAEHLGLTIDETMAIGDTENDLSIVKTAGIGVAMGNATDEIIEAANYVTSTNDEAGVAKAIYKFCNI